MNVKDRLLTFLEYLGIGQTKFEAEVGLSRGQISKMKKGISTDSLNKISAQYPGLNTNWLLTGEGEMLNHPGRPAPGDRGNPMRAYMLAVAHNYATWRVEIEMPTASPEKKNEAVKKIKEDIGVTANLILGGLDQWPFEDLKG